MRPWIKRTLLAIFGIGALAGSLSACSHHGSGPGWHMSAEDRAKHRDKVLGRVSEKLALNAQQKQRLEALADRIAEQRTAFVGKTTDPRAEARALVAGDKFDRARAQSLLTEKTAAVQAKSPEVLTALADFYDSLDATQQAKVREYMERRRGWWRRT